MRLDLSSYIALEHVEERLYRPANAYEQSVLTARERIETNIYPTDREASAVLAKSIAMDIRSRQAEGRDIAIGISGGMSPLPLLKELVHLHKEEGLSFKNVHIFPLYEFYPLVDPKKEGVLAKIREELLEHIDIPAANIHAFDTSVEKENISQSWTAYKQALNSFGGYDLVIFGIGQRASIAMNAPGAVTTADIRLTVMDSTSIREARTAFTNKENVPRTAITIGISEIERAKKVIMLAWGETKSHILRQVVEEQDSDFVPASLMQLHGNAHIYCDLLAADELTRIKLPWCVTSLKWTDKLIRRAIVWLCEQVDKPILKLTNQDYSDHQLSELLTIYGSAYDVNIKVFNDIQSTITGWPGGKPNADDSKRPERSTPYPKRVLIFSPHPDDDVISMGGTFRRLVQQGHDVHVAYETSGNIAVGDEEVIRYLSYLRNVCEELDMEDSALMVHALKLRHFLMNEKKEGSIETEEVRFMKGTIRREEARTAARFVGLEDDHVHFLDLPFYETGAIKKNPISSADIETVIKLLREIQPHEIFVAGDLADPHGTHRVALDAVLGAVDMVKGDDWFEDCWIWMYRGAWAEWEIDHIEMAVPMSPEELRFKRNSILKHQSQMESAPFLGDDERLFWQRAEDRNRATAELYRKLGLACYEAIEAFVRYIPID